MAIVIKKVCPNADVTRRRAWKNLKAGALIKACRKSQVCAGHTLDVVGVIRVVSVRSERLDAITKADVNREGFPDMSVNTFIEFFCRTMGCRPHESVRRIEFEFFLAPSRQLGLDL